MILPIEMKCNRLFTVSVFLLLSLFCASCTQEETQSEVAAVKVPVLVKNLFMFELPPNRTTAAVYARITNNSDVTQPLNYIHSPLAENIQVHRNFYENGMMQMRPVKKLSLSPGETLNLEPGGFHLMVFGLYDPLKAGDTFEITFEFETGHVLTTQVEVRSQG